jgi:hypothetical protein
MAGTVIETRYGRCRQNHPYSADDASDWNSDERLFEFMRGYFVFDGARQHASRKIRFKMNELARIAAECMDANHNVAIGTS